MIINYVKDEAKFNRYPSYYDICKKLGVGIYNYFKSMEQLYRVARIKRQKIKGRKNKPENRMKVIEFVEKQVAKGIYPSRRLVEKSYNYIFQVILIRFWKFMKE